MHPIVHIHGWSGGPAVWDRLGIADAVSPTFADVESVDGFIGAVEAALPTEPAIVMGWSMGGMLALQLALTRPERVRALVLIGTSPAFVSDDRAQGWPERAVRRMQRALTTDAEATLTQFRKSMFTDAETVAEADFFQAFTSPRSMDFSLPGLTAGLDYLMAFDVADDLPGIACPTLWIHGANDAICPAECLDAVPNNHRKTIISDAGHAPHWSHPNRVRKEILEFIHGR